MTRLKVFKDGLTSHGIAFAGQTGLSSIVDYQCPDDSRYPSAESEEEDDEHRAAALVNYSQGRTKYAYQDP